MIVRELRIGTGRIATVLDGWAKQSAAEILIDVTTASWEPHQRWLDEDRQLSINFACWIVRLSGRVVLIDTGLGSYQPTGGVGGRLLAELAAMEIRPEDITDVVFTHLHFDHVGGATTDGKPTFPFANYRCNRVEWEYFMSEEGRAQWPTDVTCGDDIATKLGPIVERLVTWEDGGTVVPGIEAVLAPGHTPGHCAVMVKDGSDSVLVLGDALHSPAQIREVEWVNVADWNPAEASRSRRSLLNLMEETGIAGSATHFPEVGFGRVVTYGGQRIWAPIEAEIPGPVQPGQRSS